MGDFFGIDFGTTNSATVGYVVNDKMKNLFKYGDSVGAPIPSVVAINKETGEVYVGREAWDRKMQLMDTCEYIHSIKSIIDSDEVKLIAGKEWTSVDVASEVFKHLKNNAFERNGVLLDKAVVAIPIGFDNVKRHRLRLAAEKAGIKITSFISEPTAAFFANYNELKSCSIVAIFDWGGGTLDVSILKKENNKVYELATVGNNVAGDDIDAKVARKIHEKISRKKLKNGDIKYESAFEDMPASAKDMMLVRAERAKCSLSDDDTAVVSINNYGSYGVCREILDYSWFDAIVEQDVLKAMDCLDKAIKQSGVGLAGIDRIVMVGGSSNLGPLCDRMEEKYGDKLYYPDETAWNVGQGAAMLSVTPGEYYSNQSIGIVLSDGAVYKVLGPDERLKNWKKKCNFGVVDSTEEARFIFGGSQDIEESSDKFKTLSLPAYRFLQEQIELTAHIDDDMVFQVSAKSRMQPKEYVRIWKYTNLKCYYKLP